MRIRRIIAIVLTHIMSYASLSEWLEMVWWWIADVSLYVFLGKAVTLFTANQTSGLFIIVGMLTIKPAMNRCAIDMPHVILEQATGRTLVATLATPITFSELTIASMLIGFVGALIRWAIAYTLLFTLFGFTIATFGWHMLIVFPLLILSGWILGMYMAVIAYNIGRNCESTLRIMTWLSIGLCGVYFPIAALPAVLQTVSRLIPLTYLFEGLRANLTINTSFWPFLLKCIWLNVLYGVFAIIVLYWAFRRAKNRGFASLENK